MTGHPPPLPSPAALKPDRITPLISRIVAFAAAAVTAAVLLNNMCSAVFQCGCRAWWSGGNSHCNIHMPGPHCPWCTHGRTGYYTALLAVVAAQALLSFWPSRMNAVLRYFIAVAIFFAVAVGVAFAYGWSYGYWS